MSNSSEQTKLSGSTFHEDYSSEKVEVCSNCNNSGYLVWRLVIINGNPQPQPYVIPPQNFDDKQHPSKELVIERCPCKKGDEFFSIKNNSKE